MEGMEGSEAACRQGADAGLIAHSTNVVEHPELVAERLLRYADIVGRDSVMASTDCGFSQSPLAGRVHRSIMWAKLKCLAEGSAIASKNFLARANVQKQS